jgi:hypothetical protein
VVTSLFPSRRDGFPDRPLKALMDSAKIVDHQFIGHHHEAMKSAKVFVICMSVFCAAGSQMAECTEFLVFYMGGQSNMDGYGKVAELPASLNRNHDSIRIFHGNPAADQSEDGGKGLWTTLMPGHGAGFSSNGSRNKYSPQFGPELSFGTELQKLLPGRKIALIKYSRGGTSIHVDAARYFGCWDPDYNEGNGINQYDHFLKTVINATSWDDIDGDGSRDRLIPAGIVWMQGESDGSFDEEIAGEYKDNLKKLMLAVQAAFRVDDIPVVIGRISDSGRNDEGKVWVKGDIIRAQQAAYVEEFQPAALVTTTDKYGYSDPWHYDTEGFIDLGRQFAIEMARLLEK